MILDRRFVLVNIQARRGDLAGLQSGDQRGLIDNTAAGTVENTHAVLHPGKGIGVQHVFGICGQGHVDRYVIGIFNDLVETRLLDPKALGAGFRQIGIVGEDLHLKGHGALGDLRSNPSQAEDTEGLAVQFRSGEFFAVPTTLAHAGAGLHDGAGAREHVRKSQFGSGNGIPGGGVHHNDTPVGSGLDIDVVDPHSGTTDHLEVRGRSNDLGTHSGIGTDRDGVNFRNQFKNLFRGRTIGFNDLKTGFGFEEIHTNGRDSICD